MNPLRKGVAYHGNRILKHVHAEMTWKTIGDAMYRITEKERDALRSQKRDAMNIRT